MENNLKLAALDIGTNSFHLIVVSVSENGNFEIIDREKEKMSSSRERISEYREELKRERDKLKNHWQNK